MINKYLRFLQSSVQKLSIRSFDSTLAVTQGLKRHPKLVIIFPSPKGYWIWFRARTLLHIPRSLIIMQCGRVLTKQCAVASCNTAALRLLPPAPTPPAFTHSLIILPLGSSSNLLPIALSRQPLHNLSHQVSHQRGPHCNQAATVVESATATASVPTSAETARTIVDIVAHGALATVGTDGVPIGTYASYILDSEGQPILRLRADAVHTRNLMREPRCSLFVQPADMPARLLARVTLIGSVEPISREQTAQVAELHRHLHGEVRNNVPPHISPSNPPIFQLSTPPRSAVQQSQATLWIKTVFKHTI